MNAPHRLFVNARAARKAVLVSFCAGAASLLGGCVGNPLAEAPVDPASPIAAEVTRAARMKAPYPKFTDIPKVPTDVRPLRQYGQAADELERARSQIEQATAPQTWTLENTEGFASQARRAAGPELAAPNQADSEAYANELRRRATPPPPPAR
ncbi:hypothetical protein [Phenylobacterium deserti]|uniref:DUF3035 domain-containing protein n=1 Tax=Phenylobacterium deserti TaxID=1914756 RepID=A0A328ABN0_9CAUL|nr:hypothetical protein [Phenylobacterium deserti]RAK52050.1 hypothetical protein DJ018_12890 [Phenylobacterium deserti]